MKKQNNRETLSWQVVPTWLGELLIICSEKGLLRITLPGWQGPVEKLIETWYPESKPLQDSQILMKAVSQLSAYFEGHLQQFDLPLDLRVTPFQEKVLDQVRQVPFGSTKTYGDIAKSIGDSNASRAVGMANNRNPLPIVIPCHRIVGSGGKLVGYAGGLEGKRRLLAFEQKVSGKIMI